MTRRSLFSSEDADGWFNRNMAHIDSIGISPITMAIVGALEPFESKLDNILEIGCGSGARLNEVCKRNNSKGYGLDPSEKAIDYCRKNYPSIQFQVGYSNSLPYADEKFNLVILGFFLYLVDRSMYLRSIAEADRVLKPGGVMIVIDFDSPLAYANEFAHNPELLAYKTNNSSVLLSSSLYSLVSKVPISGSSIGFSENVDGRASLQLLFKELTPFPLEIKELR